ncbi:hypothetical protein GCM10022381_14560 [Leifsonia kafniensis]|uniref:Lipoprotein n=1 Tax=Leifsonia kafniensis TaxID=475957 RepID=A0ABP7KBZ8_9MICO
MTRIRPAIGIPLALVLALSAAPVLSGCSSVGGLVNGAVQQASDGKVSLGGALPKGWPEEVPVIDGEILLGAGNSADGQTGWVVTIKSAAADPVADATAQLEAAGFVADASGSSGGNGAAALKNDNYTVLVAGNADGVIYTVTPLSAK